jgi:hypothetical protein
MAIAHKEAVEKLSTAEALHKDIKEQAQDKIKVKNVHTQYIQLESGKLLPGETGIATLAEASNFLGDYLEKV